MVDYSAHQKGATECHQASGQAPDSPSVNSRRSMPGGRRDNWGHVDCFALKKSISRYRCRASGPRTMSKRRAQHNPDANADAEVAQCGANARAQDDSHPYHTGPVARLALAFSCGIHAWLFPATLALPAIAPHGRRIDPQVIGGSLSLAPRPPNEPVSRPPRARLLDAPPYPRVGRCMSDRRQTTGRHGCPRDPARSDS